MPFEPPAVTVADRAGLALSAGLCARCRYLQVLCSKRSTFVRCGRSDDDPRFPRYPPLPRRLCGGYEPVDEG